MEITATAIPEVKLLVPARHADARGFLSETWSRRGLAELGLDLDFVQDNHALSAAAGTVRGLHFQIPPAAQGKLVRVTRGAIFDVAVDIRRGSPTYGRHVGATLSAAAWNQIYVPPGFAHGYCTLQPETEIIYKVTAGYAPEHERGLLWNDPDLAIDWPLDEDDVLISDRDRAYPTLAQAPAYFDWTPS